MRQLEVGQPISSVLLPKDVPTDPIGEWQGRILALREDRLYVAVLDAGYEGLDEWIEAAQITSAGEENRLTTLDLCGQ